MATGEALRFRALTTHLVRDVSNPGERLQHRESSGASSWHDRGQKAGECREQRQHGDAHGRHGERGESLIAKRVQQPPTRHGSQGDADDDGDQRDHDRFRTQHRSKLRSEHPECT